MPSLRLDPLAARRCYYCSTDTFCWSGWGLEDGHLICRNCRDLRAGEAGDEMHLFARSHSKYRARKGRREALHAAQYDLYWKLVDFKENYENFSEFGAPLGRCLADSVNELVEEEELRFGRRHPPVLLMPAPSFAEDGDPPRIHTLRLVKEARRHLHDGVQIRSEVLRKVKDIHQRGSTREERLRQNRDAYHAETSSELRGATVIVADDLFTTGTTLLGCSTALINAGASVVYGASIARVIGSNPATHIFQRGSASKFGAWRELDDTTALLVKPKLRGVHCRFLCDRCPEVVTSDHLALPESDSRVTFTVSCSDCGQEHSITLVRKQLGVQEILALNLLGRRRSEIEFFPWNEDA
jgi:hypothetical protein